jgi:hypothetical protein
MIGIIIVCCIIAYAVIESYWRARHDTSELTMEIMRSGSLAQGNESEQSMRLVNVEILKPSAISDLVRRERTVEITVHTDHHGEDDESWNLFGIGKEPFTPVSTRIIHDDVIIVFHGVRTWWGHTRLRSLSHGQDRVPVLKDWGLSGMKGY